MCNTDFDDDNKHDILIVLINQFNDDIHSNHNLIFFLLKQKDIKKRQLNYKHYNL
jgi:hypothetical protein